MKAFLLHDSVICETKRISITGLLKLFTTQARLLTTLRKTPLEKIVGKRENAGNQDFLLFPQCFLPFPGQISIFKSFLFCLTLIALNLGHSKKLSFGKTPGGGTKLK